jgi:hypothetical protein
MIRVAHEEYEEAAAECIRLANSRDATKDQIDAADARRREVYERYVALLSEQAGLAADSELRDRSAW